MEIYFTNCPDEEVKIIALRKLSGVQETQKNNSIKSGKTVNT